MDYIRTEADGQLTLTQSTEYLVLPSCLYGFHNTETTVETAKSGRIIYCHRGTLDIPEDERICSCGQRMHIHSHPDIYIRHLNIGGNLSGLLFPHYTISTTVNPLKCAKNQYVFYNNCVFLSLSLRELCPKCSYINPQKLTIKYAFSGIRA